MRWLDKKASNGNYIDWWKYITLSKPLKKQDLKNLYELMLSLT